LKKGRVVRNKTKKKKKKKKKKQKNKEGKNKNKKIQTPHPNTPNHWRRQMPTSSRKDVCGEKCDFEGKQYKPILCLRQGEGQDQIEGHLYFWSVGGGMDFSLPTKKKTTKTRSQGSSDYRQPIKNRIRKGKRNASYSGWEKGSRKGKVKSFPFPVKERKKTLGSKKKRRVWTK